MEILRARAVAAEVVFPLITRGNTDFIAGATFAAGDIKISKDGGAVANTTNTPTEISNGLYKITLTATEMTADRVSVVIVDQTSPKVWEDQGLLLATFEDTYQAKVWYNDNEASATDRYVVAFFKNGNVLAAASVTTPQIQVIKAVDGTDLVAVTALTQIGTTDSYRKDEVANRMADGATYVVKVTATIDGATRTWLQPMGRDN